LEDSDGRAPRALKKSKITADAGYHNRETLDYLEADKIDAYITDAGFRSRDPRFKDHKEPAARNRRKEKARFTQREFIIDRDKQSCRCPAGKALWLKAKHVRIGQHLLCSFRPMRKTVPLVV